MEIPVKLRASAILFGPYKLHLAVSPGRLAVSQLTHDCLKLRAKLVDESVQINLSCASIEAFEIFHDPNIGGGLMIHISPTAARKIQGILEPGNDAFLTYKSAFSGSGLSKQFIVLDVLNCDADNVNLLWTKLADCQRYHDAYWQHKLSNGLVESPRPSQSIVSMTANKWRDVLTSFGQTLHFEEITVGSRTPFMCSAIVAARVMPPHKAIETHQEAREESTNVQDDHETAEVNAPAGASRSNANALPARTPNLRKRKGEPLTNWEQAYNEVKGSGQRRTLEETREQIIQQSTDDLVVLSRKKISLICPISGRRIETAARGTDCTHMECFDLAAYLQQQCQTPYWACPFAFCDQTVHIKDLIIDGYFNHALRTTEADIKEIELQPDGLFDPVKDELADPDGVEVAVAELSDDEDLEFADNSHSSGHDLDRMLTVDADVCEQLQSTLESLNEQLQAFNFVYLSGVKASFGELHDFAREHFSLKESEMQADSIPLGLAKELHKKSTMVFRQINELGSKKSLNDLAHGLVALNSLIKQRIVGAMKADH